MNVARLKGYSSALRLNFSITNLVSRITENITYELSLPINVTLTQLECHLRERNIDNTGHDVSF